MFSQGEFIINIICNKLKIMESSHKSSTSIKNWAVDDRPREKLLNKGRESLSDSELLAILINTGSKSKSAVELGKEVLQLGQNNLDELGKLSLEDLMTIKGITASVHVSNILAKLHAASRTEAAAIAHRDGL